MSHKKSIAIVGIGCKFPGDANNPKKLWKNLLNKTDSITEIPEDRWNIRSFYHPEAETPRMSYSKWGGFVKNVDHFDPEVFGITPREAHQMDPQQRLMLEVTNNAFYDAGYEPNQFKKKSVGVFVGVSTYDYSTKNLNPLTADDVDTYTATGMSLSIVANRISYIFDLWGPSLIIDTACSSSLLAFHLAAESIHRGESELAIAGGVNLILEPWNVIAFSKMGLLSPKGRCKAFSEEAAGFVRGEGAGAVILKPLDKALKDNDRIYAVLRASGTNQDGKTNGIAVPNQLSQEALYKDVYRKAKIDPACIDYVEAHGTGTIVGDKVETGSLGNVIGHAKGRRKPCYIGSIKTNIGHLEAGSGIAGLIKATLVLHNKSIPPNLHFEKPSPFIDFKGLNLKVVEEYVKQKNIKWAAVNSFGFGGANVHAVLEKAPAQRKPKVQNKSNLLLPLSALNQDRLEVAEKNFHDWLKDTDHNPVDMVTSLLVNREIKPVKSAIIGADKEELIQVLEQKMAGTPEPNYISNEFDHKVGKVAFVFSGQGPQWYAMGKQLFEENAVFRNYVNRCDRYVKEIAGWSIIKELSKSESKSRIHNTKYAQPAITVFQIALAKTLINYGVKPEGVVGHSIGEVAAGYIAGAYSLKTAMTIILHRGSTMGRYSKGGRMIAVNIPQNELYQLTYSEDSSQLSIAALNSPISFSLAGSEEKINETAKKCDSLKLFNKVLRVEHAFHSSFMDPVEEPLLKALKGISVKTPPIQMMSSVTAEWVNPSNKLNASYWWQNVRKPVKFFPAVRKMIEEGDYDTFIEIAPHPVLKSSLAYIFKTFVTKSIQTVETIYRKQDESLALTKALAKLYTMDYTLDWSKLYPTSRLVMDLPEYPYLKKKYWAESYENEILKKSPIDNVLLGKRMPGHAIQYTNFIDAFRFPFIKDHRFRDQILFPATAYIEVFMALAKTFHPEQKTVQIEDVKFLKALSFKGDSSYVQSFIRYDDVLQEASFYSRTPQNAADWTLHSQAKIASQSDQEIKGVEESFDQIKEKLGAGYSGEVFYYFMGMNQMRFGPSFNGIEKFWYSKTEVFAEIKAPKTLDLTSFIMHPALLDITLQSSSLNRPPALEKEYARYTLVPVRMDKINFTGAEVTPKIFAHIIKKRDSMRSALFDSWIYNEHGDVIIKLTNVELYGIEMVGNNDGMLFDDWVHYAYWKELNPPNAKVLKKVFSKNLPKPLINNLNTYSAERLWKTYYHGQLNAISGKKVSHNRLIKQLQPTDAKPNPSTKSLHSIAGLKVGLKRENGSYFVGRPINKISAETLLRKYPDQYPIINALVQSPTFTVNPHLAKIPRFHDAISEDLLKHLREILCEIVALENDQESINIIELVGKDSMPIYGALLNDLPHNVKYHLVVSSQSEITELRSFYPKTAGLQIFAWNQKDAEFWSDFKANLAIGYHVEWIHFFKTSSRDKRQLFKILKPNGKFIGLVNKTYDLWELQVKNSDLFWEHVSPNGNNNFSFEAKNLIDFYKQLFKLNGQVEFNIHSLNKHHLVELTKARKSSKRAKKKTTAVLQADEVHQTIWVYEQDDEPLYDAMLNLEANENYPIKKFQDFDHISNKPEHDTLVYIFTTAPNETNNISFFIDHWYAQFAKIRTLLSGENLNFKRCYFITRNSVAISEIDSKQDISKGAFPGMIQSFRIELSAIPIHWIDVDNSVNKHRTTALYQEIISNSEELDVAYRAGQKYGKRWKKGSLLAPESILLDYKRPVDSSRYRLDMGIRNTIDGLQYKELGLNEMEENTVEIKVKAAALNFRDVLKVLGMYPSDTDDYLYLGDECAGIISRIGPGVKNHQVGDEVFSIVQQGFASHVITHKDLVFEKPKQLNFNEAASIPIVFLTAYYSLVKVAQLQAGETVFIHAGAGGVGLAAIQIAKKIGASIITTASENKRPLLKAIGVDHVFNSRDNSFADEVLRVTEGKGVDVILNSLAGDLQEISMSLLAPFGRFIEIGKRDIYDDRKTGLYKFRKNISFHIVDLSALAEKGNDFMQKMAGEIFQSFDRKNGFYPICHTVYPAEEIKSAFKFMSKGTHIGKIVISFDKKPTGIMAKTPDVKKCDPDGTYIVTGGTKGLGAEFVRFLILTGARKIIILSRSGVNEELPGLVKEFDIDLKDYITSLQVDLSDKSSLKKVIDHIRSKFPPIKGIIHAASIYLDQLIPEVSEDTFTQVCMPKAGGAWYLHELTKDLSLDYFIMTSSIASALGNAGQISYAAANSFLDQLAYYRIQQGLPATVINYGPIKDAGFVQRNQKIAQRMSRLGIELLPSRLALQLAEFAKNVQVPNIAAMRINFQNWVKLLGSDDPPTLYEEVYTESDSLQDYNKMNNLMSKIQSLDPESASILIIDFIKQTTAQILGIEPTQIADDDAFQQIGLDSLMAVEMQYKLERAFDIKISPMEVTKDPTVGGVAKIIIKQIKSE